MLFCSSKRGYTLKIRRLCFVTINSVLSNPLCVWSEAAFVMCVQRSPGGLPVPEGDEEEERENQLVPLLLPPFLEVLL